MHEIKKFVKPDGSFTWGFIFDAPPKELDKNGKPKRRQIKRDKFNKQKDAKKEYVRLYNKEYPDNPISENSFGTNIELQASNKNVLKLTDSNMSMGVGDLSQLINSLVQSQINSNVPVKTFKELQEIFMEHTKKVRAKSTIELYEGLINNHLQFFQDLNIYELKKFQINEWKDNKIANKISGFIINNSLKLCKAIVNYAIDSEIIEIANPFLRIKKADAHSKEHNHLQIEKSLEMLVKCHEMFDNDYFFPYMILAAFTGMRQGEILGLDVKNIDFERHVIKIRTQYTHYEFKEVLKTDSSYRDVDMIPFVEEVLKRHIRRNRIFKGMLLRNQKGGFIDPKNMRERRFYKLLKACNYQKNYMRVHDLRGTFVDMCITEGVPMNYVQKMVGHAKISTTIDVYSKLLSNLNEKAVNALQKVMDNHPDFFNNIKLPASNS